MTIRLKTGDMFAEPVEALVNTVNCVGVMGKGVALEFKKRWPANFREYKKLCDANELTPGQMFIYDTQELLSKAGPRYLVNFPTKEHWRSNSKISYVRDGLDSLREDIISHGIKSIAIPPLGCGNGGLDWADVKPLIRSRLSGLQNVDIVVFLPKDAIDEPEHINSGLLMTYPRAVLLKVLNDLESLFDGSYDRVSLQKVTYFLQALGIDFNLQFSRKLYGPYSEGLRKAFISFEHHGMISGFLTRKFQTHVTNSGYALADDFLNKSGQDCSEIISSLRSLIQGYESPYGLELLSSVHWLANKEGNYPVEVIISEMLSCKDNKQNSFTEDTIRSAYGRLQDDGLVH